MPKPMQQIDKNRPASSSFRQSQRPSPKNLRTGLSIVETTLIMVVIVVAMTVLFSNVSDTTVGVLDQTSSAFEQNMPRIELIGSAQSQADRDLQSDEQVDKSMTNRVLKLGMFTGTVTLFLVYTVFFISRAESSPQVKPVLAQDSDSLSKILTGALLDKRNRIGRFLREEMAGLDTEKLIVARFMTPNPAVVTIHDEAKQVMNMMVNKGFRHLIVVDDNEKLCGIISDRDLVSADGKSVSEIMTPEPFSIGASTRVSVAITKLIKSRISALPVIHDEKVVGILTRSDLLVTLQCVLANLQEEGIVQG